MVALSYPSVKVLSLLFYFSAERRAMRTLKRAEKDLAKSLKVEVKKKGEKKGAADGRDRMVAAKITVGTDAGARLLSQTPVEAKTGVPDVIHQTIRTSEDASFDDLMNEDSQQMTLFSFD